MKLNASKSWEMLLFAIGNLELICFFATFEIWWNTSCDEVSLAPLLMKNQFQEGQTYVNDILFFLNRNKVRNYNTMSFITMHDNCFHRALEYKVHHYHYYLNSQG